MSRIDLALNDIRPHLFIDGGNVEVVDITDDMCVHIKWMGNCLGCQMSEMTLKAGIEQSLKAKMPEIIRVIAVN
ncbi:MAG: NifU family protein [Saprospiraceae bacterium]